MHFEKVLLPSMPNRNCFISEETQQFYRTIVDDCKFPNSFPKKIFISRLKPDGSVRLKRAFIDEAKMIERLSSFGYEAICPETLSLKQQVALFGNATHIVGGSGSGMFNVLFAQKGVVVIDIETEPHWIAAHANLFASCGAQYAFAIGRPFEQDQRTTHRNWTLNVDDFIDAFRHIL
jgi:capsular polysaccharide biosynthesis protein